MRFGGKEFWQGMRKAEKEKREKEDSTFKAEVVPGYEIWTWELSGKIWLKIFPGKSGKEVVYTAKTDRAEIDKIINKYKEYGERLAKDKAERKANKTITGHALVAKLIREELKRKFPETKFRVKSSSFSMGNSVDIYWIDGVNDDAVRDVVMKYQGGHFNSMEDLYEYHEAPKVVTPDGKIEELPTVKYVSMHRDWSEKAENEIIEYLESIKEHDPYSNDVYKMFRHIDYTKEYDLRKVWLEV